MIKITRETDYAIVLMTSLAREPGSPASAAGLAQRCRLPQPMAGKILKALSQAGLLTSRRGAHGGYRLARPAERISVADIIEALEGPIAMTECSVDTDSACAYQAHCDVSSHWHRINQAIREALRAITLPEMGAAPAEDAAAPLRPVRFQPQARSADRAE